MIVETIEKIEKINLVQSLKLCEWIPFMTETYQ